MMDRLCFRWPGVLNTRTQPRELARLPRLARPVQVVVGDQDPTLIYCEEQGRLAAGAEYVLIENSGHFCILDQTARFNEVALDFLRRTYA